MLTNIYPINFNFDEFQIQRLDFEQEAFQQLKARYNSTHSFFRDSQYIYISPFFSSDTVLGEVITLKIAENHRIVGSLLKHIFFRTFVENFEDIKPLSFYPFSFMSRQPKHDIIYNILPENLKGKISFKKHTEIQFREVSINEHSAWGMIINIFYKWVFDINCLELFREGYDIKNKEVIHLVMLHGLENILAPEEEFIGTIISTQNGMALIETNTGQMEYPLDSLSLSKSKENMEDYLKFKIGDYKAQQVFYEIAKTDVARFNAKQLHQEMNLTIKLLSRLTYQNADGFVFAINSNSNINVKIFKPENPVFIFSFDGYKKNQKADSGLSAYGPYDNLIFDIKKPRILVLCHRTNRGTFSSFLGKLKSGLPNQQYFKTGMVDKYRLNDIEFIIEEIGSYTVQSYIEALKRTIRLNSDSLFDLALIETKAEWKNFSVDNNPYYHVKAYLLSLGIPVQLLTNDNAKKTDIYLDPLLNSIALQIYAKLGGTPWALPASTNVDREIIVGIGSSMLRSNNFKNAPQLKVVGITTFFSSDGTYLFGNKCRDVLYNEYFTELLSNLNASIKELSKRDAWINGDTIRIVFHVFKPIKNIEIDVIDELVALYSNFNIKYSFVTISESHPFMLFDENQEGVGREISKGEYVPTRGQAVVLSESSCLIQMKGPHQIKTIRQGTSKPILIRIHEKSTYKDLYYITQQIYNFTNLSWRSFFPAQMPVTLYYSDLIANILSKLRTIGGWNSEVINGPLKFKKWFL